ncbi:hypothetical protein CBM2585_A130678 [Cupriavidus taiwanensis]|nr:hypothetical protein CBM2585_A130678 [Cupriavidus taiwanensis]SOZ05946.1 hypothetical protein CBM2595_A80631 [Cupriavidus taiwanensis]SPC13328.1 hypothetical protein CT19431_50017 [Cupriavidus taiwanensis]
MHAGPMPGCAPANLKDVDVSVRATSVRGDSARSEHNWSLTVPVSMNAIRP